MGPVAKKRVMLALKIGVSAGVIYWIFHKILQQQNADKLFSHLSQLKATWVGLSALALLTAISCAILRWHRLLRGQGLHAPGRYLISTFMIGRFFGAVTPSGLGLAGYRAFDVAKHTGKTARSVATVGVEMLLGNLAVGVVVMSSCILFGQRYVGTAGVVAVTLLFGTLITVAFTILWKPHLVRIAARHLPYKVAQRLYGMVDAVCAYEGKGGLLREAFLLSVGVHAFNACIYVCAAKGLGVELPVAELFFVSVMQNLGAHLPISLNGVGVREGAAVGLYSMVGIAPEQAILIPVVGFTVEMIISSLGGLVLLARKNGHVPSIVVDDPEREDAPRELPPPADASEWPKPARGAAIGLGAGLLSGVCIGLAEAAAIVQVSHGRAEPDVWFFGALSYALFCGAVGLVGGTLLAFSGRMMERRAVVEHVAFAHLTAGMAAVFGLVIGAFRVQRDVFHEELAWKSPTGLLVLVCAVGCAAVVYVLFFFVLRSLAGRGPVRMLLRPVGSLAITACAIIVALCVPLLTGGERAQATKGELSAQGSTRPSGGNVLFIVVDTLRADHLPAYGYAKGKTPNLDAFAREAVRFEKAFSNASWTRPSFASLLTGRYASSHGVMSKESALADEAVTLAESFQKAGYATGGVVTNFNVAPFFNFQQGFDEYVYITPDFLFGASDTAAKLSLVQIVRRVDETVRGKLNRVKPGSTYHDAAAVNGEIEAFLARTQRAPWFLFAGYMDPHDPYFEHPYNGFGYSRAAHVKPLPEEADRLRTLYDGEITFWDEHFGKLLASLKSKGLYDDLTIVVTADHGEEFMDHGGFWHGTTLYDEQIHVPLFVKLPKGERAGTSVSHWVESVDIMPTLLARQNITVPEAVQGVDLFRGKEQAFAEESHEGNVLKALRLSRNGAELKVVVANKGNPRGLAERELYRVDTDVREQTNLADKDRDALAHGESSLEQAEKQAKVGALKARAVDLSMDKAAEERLKALGYAGDK